MQTRASFPTPISSRSPLRVTGTANRKCACLLSRRSEAFETVKLGPTQSHCLSGWPLEASKRAKDGELFHQPGFSQRTLDNRRNRIIGDLLHPRVASVRS